MKQVYSWLMTNKAVVALVLGGVNLLADKAGLSVAGTHIDQSAYLDALMVFLLAHHDQLVKKA